MGEKIDNLMDMRLLFYEDPRTLIANILYVISKGTMRIDKNQFQQFKNILIANKLEELANSLEGSFSDE